MNYFKRFTRPTVCLLAVVSALSVTAFAAQTGTVSENGLRLRESPTTSSAILAVANQGSTVSVESSDGNGWYKVIYQGQAGYMSTAYVTLDPQSQPTTPATSTTPATPTTQDQTNYACVNTQGSSLRVRSGPGTGYSILASVYDGNLFPILGSANGWYQISYNGQTGYVSAEFVIVKTASEALNGSSSSLGTQITAYASSFLGYPYVYGTAGPNSFDCSGFTSYVYAHFGYRLNRSSRDQYSNGVAVSKANLQAGDLVFFSGNGVYITHVGLYLGNGQFIHASTATTGVIKSDLNSTYYTSHYVGAKRIV